MRLIDEKPSKEGSGWFIKVEDNVIDAIFVDGDMQSCWYIGCGIMEEVVRPSIIEEAINIVRKWRDL